MWPALEVLIEPELVSVPLPELVRRWEVPETSSNDRFVVSPAPVWVSCPAAIGSVVDVPRLAAPPLDASPSRAASTTTWAPITGTLANVSAQVEIVWAGAGVARAAA